MKKRDRRIMDKLRMKAKAKRIAARMGIPGYAMNYDHLAKCSCWMCGNPRKYNRGEPTIQEQRTFLSEETC